ncbi:MAG: tail fiber protein [Bacteroidetes bacterium]|nr:tail fiber protein [Bacteroidota bacterium]
MESYTGEIKTYAGNYAPENWHICDGSLLSVNDYSALFTLIGTTYGGDGVNTFAIPNLSGRAPINAGQGSGLSPYSIGQTAGQETVVVNTSQLPPHNHTVLAGTTNANTNVPTNNYLAVVVDSSTAATPLGFYLPGSATDFKKSTLDPSSVSAVGGGQAHNNLMPFTALTYMICTDGIFPTFD